MVAKKQYDYGRFFEKISSAEKLVRGDTWSDYDLRTMVEQGKNNPAIVMWSIGNEVGEADGSDKSVATCSSVGQDHQRRGCNSLCHHELINSALVMDQGA